MSSPYAGVDNFPANMNIPSDGDDVDASNVNVPYEALADRTVYLLNRLAKVYTYSIDDTGFPPTVQWTSSTTAGTFTQVTDSATVPVGATGVVVVGAADLVILEATFTVATNDNGAVASAGQFEWQYRVNGGSFSRVPASRVTVRDAGTANIVRDKVVTLASHFVTAPGAGTYDFYVYGCTQTNTVAINIVGALSARAWHHTKV